MLGREAGLRRCARILRTRIARRAFAAARGAWHADRATGDRRKRNRRAEQLAAALAVGAVDLEHRSRHRASRAAGRLLEPTVGEDPPVDELDDPVAAAAASAWLWVTTRNVVPRAR